MEHTDVTKWVLVGLIPDRETECDGVVHKLQAIRAHRPGGRRWTEEEGMGDVRG